MCERMKTWTPRIAGGLGPSPRKWLGIKSLAFPAVQIPVQGCSVLLGLEVHLGAIFWKGLASAYRMETVRRVWLWRVLELLGMVCRVQCGGTAG